MDIIDTMKNYGLYNPGHEDLCFNFELSFFADEISQNHLQDDEDNKIIRVDWQGKEQSHGMFDSSGRISAFIECEKSLAHHIPALK